MIKEEVSGDQVNAPVNPRSLLSKYEIPIDHLNYEYIGSCGNAKELDRIIKILRSGEEGYFPDLQRTAEERLRCVNPSSRLLRVEEPVLTRQSLSRQERSDIASELSAWRSEMAAREARLREESEGGDLRPVPKVRKVSASKPDPDKSTACQPKAKRVSDYAAWDKYDVDTELLRMDLEDERKKQEDAKQSKEEIEKNRLEDVVKEAVKLSDVERQVAAEREKDRGNEYYHAKDLAEAEKCYSASIAIWPSPKAHNNRAACYLQQGKFSAALEDADTTLRLEPGNMKALFRRGLARQHKDMLREALGDMEEVLKLDPGHVLAQHHASKLRQECRAQAKRDAESKKLVEEFYKASKPGTSYEANEWNLPKVMRECSGTSALNMIRQERAKAKAKVSPRSQRSSLPKIVELSEEAVVDTPKSRLKIVEVTNMESENKPLKTSVVDKRTKRNAAL